MYDVTVGVIGIFAAGHYNKIFFLSVDYLYIVNDKLMVEGYGSDRLHGTFGKSFADFDVGDFHLGLTRFVTFIHRKIYFF